MYSACKRATAVFQKLIMLLLIVGLALPGKVYSQVKVGCNQITPEMGFTVSSVIVKSRWMPKALQEKVEAMIGVGEPFDPLRVEAAMVFVRNELIKGEEKFVVQLVGSTSVLFITPDICDVSDDTHPRQAAIVIRPFYLRIDLYNVGDNILPVPRTGKPTFYSKVPKLLLAATPFLGLTNDRLYGTSATVETSTDLLHLPAALKSTKDAKRFKLMLDLNARKSITELFNALGASLKLDHPVYINKGIGWNIGVQYVRELQPLGKGDYSLSLTRFFAAVNGNLKHSLLNKYTAGVAVSILKNRFQITKDSVFKNWETGYEFHAISDGHIGKGFSRMGLWFNAGVPKNNSNAKAYQRLAWRWGYAVTLGKTHNTAEIEANCNLGYSWGVVPLYNQFYAGNTLSNFLYTPLKSVKFQTFPEGPVLRSLGEREGGFKTSPDIISGGNAYWNVNLSISIPVAKWSVPLIPDIVIDEETGSTARRKIKGQVNFAQSLIQMDLVDNQGLSEEAADAEAERIVNKDIRPAINYLADRANVYSIKPMLFFDVAQVNKRQVGNKLWGAAGAGLQLNIVNAKLEIGYMHTLFPQRDGSKGNFLFRFTVQDFY